VYFQDHRVIGAVAFERLKAGGKLWRLAVDGTEDQYEWERFLGSMPGEPRRVVGDGSSAIAKAVRAVWPGAVIYDCEWHVARSGAEKLRPAELGDAYQPLLWLVQRSAEGPDEWADLERAVRSFVAGDASQIPSPAARLSASWPDRRH